MKKFLSLVASAVMMFSLVAMPVHAEEGVTTEADLISAIAQGEEVVVIDEDITLTKNLALNGMKNIKFIGADGDEVLTLGNYRAGDAPGSVNNITFENLTIVVTNNDYVGFKHSTSETFINCTIEGVYWTYAQTATFNNCTFKQTTPYYNIWCYGSGLVNIDNCTFETAGKSVLIYNEGSAPSGVFNITNTKFIANEYYQEVDKAAIEIDSHLMAGKTYTVNVENCEVDHMITSGLYRDKLPSGNLTVNEENITIAHKTTIINATEASCDKAGYTGDEYCEVCDIVLVKGEEIPAKGHTLTEIKASEPTCQEPGRVASYYCEVCKKYFKDAKGTTEIDENETYIDPSHKYEKIAAKEATCTATGNIEYFKCSACGEMYKLDASGVGVAIEKEADTVIAKKAHTYVEGECTECGAKDSTYVAPTLPTVDAKEEVKEVTVGTDTETTKEVLTETATTIVETIIAGEETTAVSEEVVKVIEEAVKNNDTLSVDTTVVVTPLDEEDVEEEHAELIVKTAGEDAKVAQYLDLQVLINVKVNGKTVEIKENEVAELPTAMTFTVAIPEELKEVEEGYTRNYFVIRVHENKDGKLEKTKLPVTVNKDGTLSFSTDQFSTYALAYEDTLKVSTQTGDNAPVMMYATMTMMAAAALVVLKKKESLVK